jgi:hypothetical protein
MKQGVKGVLRFLAGLLLLPVCAAATQTLLALIAQVRPDSTAFIPAPALAMAGGYALWLLAYFTMPKPVRTYVLAHELTHALWGALMGARILRMSVSKHRGSVTLSKNNFLITLAPYFFPLYTVLVVVAYYLAGLFVDVRGWTLFWLGCVGFTWGFHLTFTVSSLMQHQSDIQLYGRLFSYTVIYLLNVAGICLWVVFVASPRLADVAELGAFYLREMAFWVMAGARQMGVWGAQYLARPAR